MGHEMESKLCIDMLSVFGVRSKWVMRWKASCVFTCCQSLELGQSGS